MFSQNDLGDEDVLPTVFVIFEDVPLLPVDSAI